MISFHRLMKITVCKHYIKQMCELILSDRNLPLHVMTDSNTSKLALCLRIDILNINCNCYVLQVRLYTDLYK